MADPGPWLTIIGIGEDGLLGLSEASRKALSHAETVFGGKRHLALADAGGRGRSWPTPFDVSCVFSCRGRPTVVLASGDPFWHGVGSLLTERLNKDEWIAYPAPSTFSLAALMNFASAWPLATWRPTSTPPTNSTSCSKEFEPDLPPLFPYQEGNALIRCKKYPPQLPSPLHFALDMLWKAKER